MIVIDYAAIAIAGISVTKDVLDEEAIRVIVLNSIRFYRKKFRDQGEVVIACDSGNVWRKKVFEHYKYSRSLKRAEASTFDWNLIFNTLNLIKEEIDEYFPYRTIKLDTCEADDIIGALAEMSDEFGRDPKVMIISGDSDFGQLQRYSGVKQFSNITKKFIKIQDPAFELFTLVCRGQRKDDIPSVLSVDRQFVDSIRQKPLSKNDIAEWYKTGVPETFKGIDVGTHFKRNDLIIDLSKTPRELKNAIIDIYDAQSHKSKTLSQQKILNYLIKKRCKHLISVIEDFF